MWNDVDTAQLDREDTNMKIMRNIIEIDEDLCDGCGNCIIACAEGALEIVGGKAKLKAETYCDGLGACLGECPTGALKVIQREAEDFDEEAVAEHLKQAAQTVEADAPVMACGCPSSHIQTFDPAKHLRPVDASKEDVSGSTLSHWPVQIRLVPSKAPFLKKADLLVVADCVPVAYPWFHRDFLPGKVALVGCPKFDDASDYIDKFAEIFRTADVRSVTILVMEVPCCHGLPRIVEAGLKKAGKQLPVEIVVVGVQGEILKREKLVA
jgi:ferredoxin